MANLSATSPLAGEPPASATPLLDVRDVSKRYVSGRGRSLLALDSVSLHVAQGEFVALVGPSGCGKSTLLSIIAGLEDASSGAIVLRGDPQAPRLGHIGYMPQRDLLLPWRDALGNAITGLRVQGVSRAEAEARARALFADFGLSGFERAYPTALSGGMRQRVAFARTALVTRDLMLLDEPFGALDALTRAALQRWLGQALTRLGTTCLLVTHDVDEALALSDRIYALSPRPGHVRLERRVPLPHPRSQADLALPAMAALKAELLDALLGATTDDGALDEGGAR
ncbi:MAG TPA: ABC transporter ATP-binding protein [Ktedonobacterales bacterium]|jgi:ABC-type nitrate/sulfonate/bicarbonate transport system ATPase subunit|nr:ABC transporter ATP-binding protein [Ktedonobacterales bacterium]